MGLHAGLGRPAPHRLSLRIKGFGLRLQIASPTLEKDALISGNRAHTLTDVAVVAAARAHVAGIEEQAAGVFRPRRVQHGRPVVAARTGILEVGDAADARCRQENATTVGSGKQPATNAVLRRPSMSAVICQFNLLLF